MATRKIVYDDQDSEIIQYSGDWLSRFSAEESIGNFGPTYLHTLHGTKHNVSISFEFDGMSIEVYGTNIVADSKTNPDPNLECFVDGVSIGREPAFEFPENNWKLCGSSGFSAGPHKLQIEITVQSPNQTFWLDRIQFAPSSGTQLQGKTVLVANTDPAIRLDENWHSLAPFKATSKTNSVAQIDFIGTSVSWVGYIPVELPHGGASGTYSIDGGKPVNFDLAGLTEGAKESIYNQVFFTTPVVENGPHTLTVTFLGSGSTTPLTLDLLYITNGTLAASSSGTPNSSTVTTSAFSATDTHTAGVTSDGEKSGLNVGAILGGILGGLGLLILFAAALLYRRHRRLSKENVVQSFRGSSNVSVPSSRYSNIPTGAHLNEQTIPGNMMAQATYHSVPLSTKRREAGYHGESGPAGSSALYGIVPLSRGGHPGQMHTDSGVRLNQPLVEDMPPNYTLH